jgi:proteasome lid subunit RPN8/RPN11
MTEPLLLPVSSVAPLTSHVRGHGTAGVETGAILLAPIGTETITTIALAGTNGVVRRQDLFVMNMRVIDAIFSYAEQLGLQARVHLHSHRGGAFLSDTDRAGGIRVPGFIAAVLPTYRNPPSDPKRWGWWSFSGTDWNSRSPAELVRDLPTTIITADAEGIRA